MRWLADHHGVITSTVLRTCGIGRPVLSTPRRERSRAIGQQGRLVLATAPTSLEQRCAALSAAHPSGFVTGPTAGALLGLRRMPRTLSLHFSVRHGVHVVERASAGDRPRRSGCSPHDTPGRDPHRHAGSLAFDLAADLGPLDHLSVLHQLLDQRRCHRRGPLAIGKRLCHPARDGSARFTRVARTPRLGGSVAVTS